VLIVLGKGNIVNEFEREAKEVERIFKNQEQEFFLPGPTKQQEERGRAFE